MAAGIPARLSAREGRAFGLTVGAAFVAIAAFVAWRGHTGIAGALAALGLALILGGVAIPTRLGPVQRGWMALAHAVSKVTTPLVMGAIYFLVILPVGLLRRAFGGNPLVHEESGGSFWKQRPEGARRTRSLERQF